MDGITTQSPVSPPSAPVGLVPAGDSWSEVLRRTDTITRQFSGVSGKGSEQLVALLQLQSQVSHWHLRIELISRAAESATATMRRMQQG